MIGLGWLMAAFVVLPGAAGWAYDYEAYLNAGARLGATGTLYQVETLSGAFRPGPYGLYLYPPPLGVAMGPLSALSIEVGAAAWFIAHLGALALACALMPVRTPTRVLAFAVGALSLAVLRDLVLGNVSVLLLLPVTIAWRCLDRPAGSVALAAAIALRPTLALLLVWQLLRRRWRAVGWAIGAGIALVLLTLPFVGLDGYFDYLTVLRNLTDIIGVERNADLGSTALNLGATEEIASLVLLAGYVLAGFAILVSLRRDREVGFMVTLGASLLLAPLLWDHYLAILILPAAFLAERGRPVAILLPLLSWLPQEMLAGVAVLATVLPFWVRDSVELLGVTDMATPGATPTATAPA